MLAKFRRSTRVIFIIALTGVLIETGLQSAAADNDTGNSVPELLVSSVNSRANAVSLADADLSGNAYIFVAHDGSVDKVIFWLDNPARSGPPTSTEGVHPFDLVGGWTRAEPFDTTRLASGNHTLIADVTFSDGGRITLRATFGLDTSDTTTPGDTAPATPSTGSPSTTVDGSAWPGVKNTGVPARTALKPVGGTTVTADGTVIEGVDMSGCLIIKADNVVVRNSRITCGASGGSVISATGSGVLLENLTIDGGGRNANGIAGRGFTARRVNVSNSSDGIRAGSNTIIEYSWIHDLVRLPGSHNDTVQTIVGTDVTIRHNYLQPYTDGDPMNAAYIFGPSAGPVRNLRIYNNLIDGGNYSIAGTADGIYLANNVFTRNHRYGAIRLVSPATVVGNRYVDGVPVS